MNDRELLELAAKAAGIEVATGKPSVKIGGVWHVYDSFLGDALNKFVVEMFQKIALMSVVSFNPG